MTKTKVRGMFKIFGTGKAEALVAEQRLQSVGIRCKVVSEGDEFGYGETFAVFVASADKMKYFGNGEAPCGILMGWEARHGN